MPKHEHYQHIIPEVKIQFQTCSCFGQLLGLHGSARTGGRPPLSRCCWPHHERALHCRKDPLEGAVARLRGGSPRAPRPEEFRPQESPIKRTQHTFYFPPQSYLQQFNYDFMPSIATFRYDHCCHVVFSSVTREFRRCFFFTSP